MKFFFSCDNSFNYSCCNGWNPKIWAFDTWFWSRSKMGQSTIIPGTNPQKQPRFISVLCEDRLFYFTGADLKWNNWNRSSAIYEAKIIADVCHLFETSQSIPVSLCGWETEEAQALGADVAEGESLCPAQAGALQLMPISISHCPVGSDDPKESHR